MNTSTVKTPFPRLITGISLGFFGYYIAMITPLALLLTIKLAMLDPANVTKNFSIVSLVGAPIGIIGLYVAGVISDRTKSSFGRRRPWILMGAIGGAAALYAIGMAQSVIAICILWGAAKFLSSFMMSALTALIPDQVPEDKRGTASGIMGIFAPISIMAGVNLMFLFNSWSVENKFLLLGGIAIVMALVTCMLIKEEKVEYRQITDQIENQTWKQKLSRIYPSPKAYPEFSYGVLTRFLMAVAYSTSAYASVYYLEHFQIAQEELAGIVSVSTLVTTPFLIVSSIVGGIVSDKIGRQKPFIIAASLVVALGIVGYAFAPTIAVSYASGAVLSFGFGMFLAVDIALMTRILPHKEDAAKDMGIVNMAHELGNPTANAMASPLVGVGGYPLFFGLLAALSILASITVTPIKEPQKIKPEHRIAQ